MKTIAVMGIAVALGAGGALAFRLAGPEAKQEQASEPVISSNEATAPRDDGLQTASYPGGTANSDMMPDSPINASQPVAATAPANAGSTSICGQTVPLMADGRLLNHYSYGQAAPADLVSPPAGFGGGNCSQIKREMLAPLQNMIAAAKKENPAVGKALMGVSCFRSIPRQTDLFCRPDRIKSRGIAGQAKWVAPGGFSEHATGLTIDFGARTRPECHVSPCFKDTETGKWLAANAGRFGFELSFPSGNAQGVSYEPWHFRYVGSDTAKSIFAKARAAR